jgi:hypothetical protein
MKLLFLITQLYFPKQAGTFIYLEVRVWGKTGETMVLPNLNYWRFSEHPLWQRHPLPDLQSSLLYPSIDVPNILANLDIVLFDTIMNIEYML